MLQQNINFKLNKFFLLWYLLSKLGAYHIFYKYYMAAHLRIIINLYLYRRIRWRQYEDNGYLWFKYRRPITFNDVEVYRSTVSGYSSIFFSKKYPWLRGFRKFKKIKKFLSKLRYNGKILKPHRVNMFKFITLQQFIPPKHINKTQFSLSQRITLNKKKIQKATAFHLYKKVKYRLLKRKFNNLIISNFEDISNYYNKSAAQIKFSQKIAFFNRYKKFYWKLRKSRITHWEGLRGNVVNKYRYQKFFKNTIRKNLQAPSTDFFLIILSHLSTFFLTWRQAHLIIKYQLVIVNGQYFPKSYALKKGDIIEVCYGRGFHINNAIYHLLNSKIVYRLKRWSYKNYLNYTNQTKVKTFKAIPKSVKSIGFSYKLWGKAFGHARHLGLLAILYPIQKQTINPLENLYKTTIIKLHTWRYKF